MSASITNVGPAHIGYMGSEEAIADEKACLFAGMAQGAVAVLNRDSRALRTAGAAMPVDFGVSRIVGFGRSEAAEARLVACRLQDYGQRRCRLDPWARGSSIALARPASTGC